MVLEPKMLLYSGINQKVYKEKSSKIIDGR